MDQQDIDNDVGESLEEDIDILLERFTKQSSPLAMRREIERRRELAKMRDDLGIDDFDM
ncbi:MAG: hypothetical protein ACJAYC_002270 [Halieaceae bacterium]|jgi:hypothetical protein